jgi:GNAT superfamily N-acetyltransferase
MTRIRPQVFIVDFGLMTVHYLKILLFCHMIVRTIVHDSEDYHKMIELRIKHLLEPIGVPASYINKVKEKDDILIGAFEGEQILGCCVLTPKDKGLIQLRQMVVNPEVQGRGIGADIVRFAEDIARENGFTTLMMHARNPAIKFYEKSGYTITGSEFFEVGIGHHRMEKRL